MKKLTKIIIVIIIIIVILLILLYILRNKEKKNTNNENNQSEIINDEEFEIKPDENITEVTSTELAFNIKQCIQYFYEYVQDDNYEAVMEVLDTNYVKEKNLNVNNVKNICSNFKNTTYIINKIHQKEKTIEKPLYFVNGEVLDGENYEKKSDLAFTIIIDVEHNAFSIIPEILNDDNFNYNFDITYDNENYYNDYTAKAYTDAEIVDEYFGYYSKLINKNPNEAYNLLDGDYKKYRFNNSIEKYKEYLKNIDLQKVYPDKYTIDYTDNDQKEYIVIDKNGFTYIINELSPMNITFKLDTYTIMSDKFKNTYDKGTNENKTSMNVDKWMMMIQNKDFENAYNLLDETFRNNNFGNVENFKQYMNNKYSTALQYQIGNSQQYNGDVYTQKVTITKEDGTTIDTNFVVKLLDNRQFVLSFEK